MPEQPPKLHLVEKVVDKKTRQLAEKYLSAREKRANIELDTQSRIDAWPARMLELWRGRRFAKSIGVSFEDKIDRDIMLPSLARDHAPDYDN